MADDYTVNEYGTIQNPGRFEGEPIHLPHFYDLLLEGFADSCGPASLLPITDEDRAAFPLTLDPGDRFILIWSSDSGFINSRLYADADVAERALESFAEPDEEEI